MCNALKHKSRVLVTCTDLMMIQFLVPHVKNLVNNGYEVEIACSDVGNRMQEVRTQLSEYVSAIHIVRLVRSPANPVNLKGYKDMKRVISTGDYDYIWTNEPVMGVVTRLAARQVRKKGTVLMYMVHGFHFFKGARLLNWMLFYPIEYLMSFFTDVLTTINQEDFQRAQKMHAKEVRYIHGIGINTERLNHKNDQTDIRKELALNEDAFLLLSIGELSKRKNQQIIIRALGKVKDPNIHYIICGKGDMLDELKHLSEKYGLTNNVHFLGYRKDVVDICSQVDLFALPSIHEGLSVASLEAMYCELPVIISDIRGVHDYLENGKTGYICKVDDVTAFAKAIRSCKNHPDRCSKFGKENKKRVIPFCIEESKKEVLQLFIDM